MNPDNRIALEDEHLKAEAKARTAELIARWRRDYKLRTGKDSTCTDTMALELATMAAAVGRLA